MDIDTLDSGRNEQDTSLVEARKRSRSRSKDSSMKAAKTAAPAAADSAARPSAAAASSSSSESLACTDQDAIPLGDRQEMIRNLLVGPEAEKENQSCDDKAASRYIINHVHTPSVAIFLMGYDVPTPARMYDYAECFMVVDAEEVDKSRNYFPSTRISNRVGRREITVDKWIRDAVRDAKNAYTTKTK